MRNIAVFAGLTLTRGEASVILQADHCGPLRRDCLAALPRGTLAVVIDGVLDTELRPIDADIRAAIDRGVTILGASSTGALIARRIQNPSVRGFGRVFRLLSTLQENTAEDLVTVLYDPFTERVLTEPLVNGALALARSKCCNSASGLRQAIRELRRIDLQSRSRREIWDTVQRIAGRNAGQALRYRDYKADDARRLLHVLSRRRSVTHT